MNAEYPLTVFYEDTDAAGIVYHANYLKFAERARSTLLRDIGAPVERLLADHGGYFIVRDCHIRFVQPATLGDELCVRSTLEHVSGARMKINQPVFRDQTLLADIAVEIAFVNSMGRPTRLPQSLKRLMDTRTAP